MKKTVRNFCLTNLLLFNVLTSHSADLIDVAATDGSFKRLVGAIHTAGLADMLKSPGPYTFFAPTDEALSRLSDDELSTLTKSRTELAKLISMHLVPGKIMIADVKPGNVQTLQGGTVKITSDNGKVVINDANVTQSDVAADNGVIHAIDRVVTIPK